MASPMTQTNELDTEGLAAPNRDHVVDAISATMARMRVMMGRRFMSRLALSRLDESHSLELSHFDVVKTVAYIARDQEVTVGAIADHLRIDPSRASRVVADLVRRGTLRREASQFDARRTVVALTEAGEHLQVHFDTVRREVIGQTLEDWSEEDVHQLQTLFDRFISALECRTQPRRGEVAE
jgi:DNA-binding MarR family transcriptional regulator